MDELLPALATRTMHPCKLESSRGQAIWTTRRSTLGMDQEWMEGHGLLPGLAAGCMHANEENSYDQTT